MKQILKTYPFFLILLPLFIVVHIEKECHPFINYRFVYMEIIHLYLVPVFGFILSFVLTRSHRKSAILTFCIMLVYYFSGEVKELIRKEWGDVFWQSYTFIAIAAPAILMLTALIIRKSRRRFEKTYLFLNMLLLIFVVLDIGAITWISIFKKTPSRQPLITATDSCSNCMKPDIYYLIFDSYTSSSCLKDNFDFDNSSIDSTLRSKGFKVIPYSKSNYNFTAFSVASTFNMDFLPEVDTIRPLDMRMYLPGLQEIYKNPLFPLVEELGYDIRNHSLFNVRNYPTTVPPFDIWEVYSLYRQHNLIKKIYFDIGWTFPSWARIKTWDPLAYGVKRNRHDSIALQHILASILEDTEKPKFVYGHIFIPHGPYTFDSAGNKVNQRTDMTQEEKMRAYVQQIGYVNRIMTVLADTILSTAKRPPVIIIQGDHGFRFSEPDKHHLHFPNYNAIYFPEAKYELLHDSLTSVNTFRVVSNVFFGQNWPLLDGRTHFFR